jgi:hypothetical protein
METCAALIHLELLMNILIPSSNRPHKQTTYDNLPQSLKEKVTIVIPFEQKNTYPEHLPIICTPPTIRGIGATRQWICDVYFGKILMLDDDIVFATRRDDNPSKFRDSTEEELVALFDNIESCMDDGFVHGAVAPREGANRTTDEFLYNVRCLRALFYNSDVMHREKIRFTDMEVMEDFHVALSLLRLGYPSVTHNYMVQNQNGSDLPGGCSVYRTSDVQRKAALELQAKHPDFVKVVEKTTKTAWGGTTRTDVNVAWKKAYNSAPVAPRHATGEPFSTAQGTPGNG